MVKPKAIKTERSAYHDLINPIRRLKEDGATHEQIAKEFSISVRLVSFYIEFARKSGIEIKKGIPALARHKLGQLCSYGHDYKGTGKSLRSRSGSCLECNRRHQKRYREKQKEKMMNQKGVV
jgi:hypothetical protein